MKAVITGANGTVGKVLCQFLRKQQVEVVAWDRKRVPIDEYYQMERFVRQEQPDVLFHLAIASQSTGAANESWLVNYEWPSELAWICKLWQVSFVFTSSVMVFTDEAKGPFTVQSEPNATAGYGYEKRMAEKRVFYQNPQARVARLGWQIGEEAGSNNMIDFLEKQMKEKGEIRASTKWYPACSFLADTAAALWAIAQAKPGLYLVDANERWTFFEIVQALADCHGYPWRVVPTEDFVFDQRMRDDTVPVNSLQQRLSQLAG